MMYTAGVQLMALLQDYTKNNSLCFEIKGLARTHFNYTNHILVMKALCLQVLND